MTDHVVADVPIQVALNAVAAELGPIAKDDVNKDQGFKFRGIERIMAAAGPVLDRHGVVPIPRVISVDRGTMERGQNRSIWQHYLVTVKYLFVGPQGDHVDAVVVGEGLDNADKCMAKAMTVAYKIALLQVLKIGDPESDADATTPPEQTVANRAQPRKTQSAAKKAAPRQQTTPRPTPARPSAETQAKAVVDQYGAEHGRRVANLIERFDTITDTATRAIVKGEFRLAFGLPVELTPDRIDEAMSWVLAHTREGVCPKCADGGVLTVADGDENGGSHEEPCDCPAGEAAMERAMAQLPVEEPAPQPGETPICARPDCEELATGDGTFCPADVPF